MIFGVDYMSKFNSILCIRLASSERREFKNKGYYGVKIPNKSSIMYNHKTNLKFDDLASLSQLVYVNEELKYDQDLYNFIKDYPTGQKFYVFENNSVYATGEFINDSYVKNNELRRKATFPLFKACLFPKNMKKVEEFSFYINDHFRQEFLDSRLQTKKDEPVIEIKESVEKVSKKKKRESSTVVTIIRKDSIEEIGKYNPTTHERKEIEQEIRKYGDVVTPLYQSEVYQSCVNATKQRLANLRSYNDTNHMVSSNIKFSKTDVINSIYTKNKHIPKIIKTNSIDTS